MLSELAAYVADSVCGLDVPIGGAFCGVDADDTGSWKPCIEVLLAVVRVAFVDDYARPLNTPASVDAPLHSCVSIHAADGAEDKTKRAIMASDANTEKIARYIVEAKVKGLELRESDFKEHDGDLTLDSMDPSEWIAAMTMD